MLSIWDIIVKTIRWIILIGIVGFVVVWGLQKMAEMGETGVEPRQKAQQKPKDAQDILRPKKERRGW